jgi:hypothetical protein
MDVTNVSRQAQPAVADRAPHQDTESQANQPQNSAQQPGGPLAASEPPHTNPAISLDAATNATVLKFQEAGGVVFQVPSVTTLQYQRHQELAAQQGKVSEVAAGNSTSFE